MPDVPVSRPANRLGYHPYTSGTQSRATVTPAINKPAFEYLKAALKVRQHSRLHQCSVEHFLGMLPDLLAHASLAIIIQ